MEPFEQGPGRASSPSRGIAAVVALLVLLGGAVLAWQLLGTGRHGGSGGGVSPHVSEAGYWVVFPDQARPGTGQFSVQVTASTNLPDGTLVSIDTTDEGTCCPAVKDGTITVST